MEVVLLLANGVLPSNENSEDNIKRLGGKKG
jgi:hypothetical protein